MSELIMKEEDLKDSCHWPVIALFGFFEGEGSPVVDFVHIVESLGRGKGYGYNDAGCTFWDDLDEYDKSKEDEPFEIYCYVVDEGCVLSYDDMFDYLKIASDRYAQRYPGSSRRLQAALDAFAKRFPRK